MKWKNPSNGDKRTVRKFLWFPLVLDGETRWLEFAWVIQEYYGGHDEGGAGWYDKEWLKGKPDV